MDFNLLKELCSVHAPSGNEIAMKEFLIAYITSNQHSWKVQPHIIQGDEFQDSHDAEEVGLLQGDERSSLGDSLRRDSRDSL